MRTLLTTLVLLTFSAAINASDLCVDSIGNTLSNFGEMKVHQCEDVCIVLGSSSANEEKGLVLLHALDDSSDVSKYQIDHFYSAKKRTGNPLKGYSYTEVELGNDLDSLNLEEFQGRNHFMGKPKKRTLIELENSTLNIYRKVGRNVLVSEELDCSL